MERAFCSDQDGAVKRSNQDDGGEPSHFYSLWCTYFTPRKVCGSREQRVPYSNDLMCERHRIPGVHSNRYIEEYETWEFARVKFTYLSIIEFGESLQAAKLSTHVHPRLRARPLHSVLQGWHTAPTLECPLL